MTTDVDALQQICPQLHALWSAPIQIVVVIVNTSFANAVPVLVTVVAFGSYTMLGGILTLAKAFTSLSLFVALRFSLTMFPTLVTAAVNANVSLKRLQELLLAEEHMLQENPPLESGVPAILIKNGTFSWEPNADVFLFDDPLSALDMQFAHEVFDKCLRQELRGNTRVLVTNQLHFLSHVDKIVLVHQGEVKEQGTYDELLINGPLFKELLEKTGMAETTVSDDADARAEDVDGAPDRDMEIGLAPSLKLRLSSKNDAKEKVKEKSAKALLIKEEEREAGLISGKVLSSLAAAQCLHNGMLEAMLRAPMSFFHSNPIGRIMNHFAKDTGDIDRDVAVFAGMFLTSIFQLISTFLLFGFVNTISLWSILPLLVKFYYAREVKHLDSITQSPVYAQFAEALNGLAIIWAYKVYDRIAKMNGNTMDTNSCFTLVNISSYRWLSMRLEFLRALMIWIVGMLAVLGNVRASDPAAFAPLMGRLLSYAFSIAQLMTNALRLASTTENRFNAVDRVGNYTDVTPEAPPVIEDERPPPGWPSAGFIEFKNVVMRYTPELPPVLHGLSVKIRSIEKVGIVGRTGAGKSSMLNTLFRIVEVEQGHILIDGLDIEGMDHAHLKDVVQRNSLGLEAEVNERGENCSVGPKAAIEFGTSLVAEIKGFVLEEATAAVDVGTDALIQKTVCEQFKPYTMLTIAHWLNTGMDSDHILVLDAGRVIEMDTPQKLLLKQDGIFSSMVQSTGAANSQYICTKLS
ncbi:unnamed protein product [Sphagnum troendelagicum]|uniref:Uncharacterized protein n=1 Tax=Sphagnum troendelagicum TaxID=128251 RepID=A0ABP0TXR6_9BRYO